MNRIFITVLTVGILTTLTNFCQAQGVGNPLNTADHPRVNEVNSRIDSQAQRIHQGVENGTISPARAAEFAAKRAQLKGEERSMRKADGGHLTSADQAKLNRQLNRRSGRIYGARH